MDFRLKKTLVNLRGKSGHESGSFSSDLGPGGQSGDIEGVEHIALQFMAPRYPERVAQIERFGKEILPSLEQVKN